MVVTASGLCVGAELESWAGIFLRWISLHQRGRMHKEMVLPWKPRLFWTSWSRLCETKFLQVQPHPCCDFCNYWFSSTCFPLPGLLRVSEFRTPACFPLWVPKEASLSLRIFSWHSLIPAKTLWVFLKLCFPSWLINQVLLSRKQWKYYIVIATLASSIMLARSLIYVF